MAEVKNNKEKNRYELSVDGKTAVAEYILNKQGVLFFTHTEVPDEFEGQGVASKLMEGAFKDAEERDLKIAPICPFVKVYLQRHPEWKRLLAEEHKF
ncbi:GNAT family N-acetyltransferase [Rhodohalobacter sp.]|uniref:GNAT family N-acetyltransferase n=1 Tax=Rhodohalobacter sp. TaxID=1974210 RepID=UPI002ACD44FD|nr:GNAT family N-acetyltransferase [Rhodohalobacter sp.]MDZ7755899.1 GNAT family N-acetyltransferase [Rhodohalobacter sp.]